jgi:hypothetical protein
MHTRTETLTLRLCLAFDDDNADVIATTLGEFIGGCDGRPTETRQLTQSGQDEGQRHATASITRLSLSA